MQQPAQPAPAPVPAPITPCLPSGRAAELIQILGLAAHPEGGWYRELYRSTDAVQPGDGRATRQALTSIDFLLAAGERSAWHRVQSDEVWHLLEGGPLLLWLVPPTLDSVQRVLLGPASASPDGALTRRPWQVVPAGWWQAAEPLASDTAGAMPSQGFAYAGATVGPGFEFTDFAFGRDHPALGHALARLAPDLQRLL